MSTVSDYFGSLVFDDRVMKAMLSADVYQSLKKTIDEGASLNNDVANAVAAAMKDWAVEHGATHFTHWFQPLTGITAEKHDSFITPASDGRVIMEFSGKELIKGEPDASSFPSGGLRATFEARGYTAWDPTSYAFIKDKTLCKLGVLAKTEHNEVAPSQHELAPIYTTTNIATDHNQLTMEIMQKVAAKHGLVCLLHEKPFAGVNGSGKHNNWSMATDTGVNLLTPGETPYENAQFLLFLCAVIKAVDDYQDLLRVSVATAGNDHRLGANEAPPAVVSMFLGDELTAVLDAIENDAPYSGSEKTTMKLGVHVLPKFTRDTTDRNRTSPFAFTGNKFEFRMLGSSNSIACANIMLNAAVAESLKIYADRLENVDDFETALHDMIKKTIKDHKRIIFNGNGYDDAWIKEATEKRGLLNLRTTPDAMPAMIADKNVKMLTAHKIFSPAELHSRYEILLENYSKTVNIEALTMVDMARKEILPAVEGYTKSLAETLAAKKAAVAGLPCKYETATITKLSELSDEIADATADLDSEIAKFQAIEDVTEAANDIRDVILGKMDALRAVCDEAETITAKEFWPFPTYSDLLFSVK